MKIYIISKLVKNCYKKEEEPKLLLTQQKKRKTKKPLFLYIFKWDSKGLLTDKLRW
jgi:hypothetical protein